MGLYSVIKKIFTPVFKKLYRVEFCGAENEPADGPFLICPNHLSDMDVFVIAACMKHHIRYCAKAELFKVPLVKQFVSAMGAFPIKRGAADVSAIKTTLRLLSEGECVGIYPQGTRHQGEDPRETEVKAGAGMIAYRSKVTVLPVCIQMKKFRMRLFRKTRVTFGKPIPYEEFGFDKGTKSEFEDAAKLIFDRVTDMLIPDGDMIK